MTLDFNSGSTQSSANSTNQVTLNDAIGNQADDAKYASSSVDSIMAYTKALLNANVLYAGTVQAGSTTSIINDTGIGGAGSASYYVGSVIVWLPGSANAGQVRSVSSTSAGVSVSPTVVFANTPVVGDKYILVQNQASAMLITGAVDSTSGAWLRDVVGTKSDASAYQKAATKSAMAYLKALIDAAGLVAGTVTTGTSTTSFADTGLGAYASSYFLGAKVVFITGANAGRASAISSFTTTSGTIGLYASLGTTPSIGDTFVIVTEGALKAMQTPGADVTGNTFMSQVLGDKADTRKAADTNVLTNESGMKILKGLWECLWKVQTSSVYSNTALGTSEVDIINIGAVGASNHYKLESLYINLAALGTGTTTVKIRTYVDINGVSVLVATQDRTTTGAFAPTTPSGTGVPVTSRAIRVTVQRNEGSGTDGSLSATAETSKASV